MIDLKALQAELEEARKVRMAAEETGFGLEALISDMRRAGLDFRFDPDEYRAPRTKH